MLISILVTGLLSVVYGGQFLEAPEVVFEWKQIDYNYASDDERQAAIDSREYIPEDNVIMGMKIYKDRIFLTVPRWREGVPATLNTIQLSGSNKSPKLQPYPSLEYNKFDDCAVLQNVVRTEVDSHGRLWVLDSGRTNILSGKVLMNCHPKIVVIDLETDESVRQHEFSEHVASHDKAWLTYVALDDRGDPDDVFAYISDPLEGRIVVYSYKDNRSWTVQDASLMYDPKAIPFKAGGVLFNRSINVVQGAVSPDSKVYYYAALSSYDLFSVPTEVLRSPETSKDISAAVTNIGKMLSPTDAIHMCKEGVITFGLLTENAIATWDATTPLVPENIEIVAKDDEKFQFLSDFAEDADGNLWFVANRLSKFLINVIDFSDINFRIAKMARSSVRE